MKGIDVFDSMNSLPADMVTAAELPQDELTAAGYGISEKQKRREKRALIFSSGWFAAAVSVVVALTAVVLIVAAGRNGGRNPIEKTPAGSHSAVIPAATVPSEIGRGEMVNPFIRSTDWMECNDFAFRFEILNESEIIHPGDTVTLRGYVKNIGTDFTYTGGSGDFCPQVILIGGGGPGRTEMYSMLYPLPEDYGTFAVSNGDVGQNTYTLTLPDDCPVGAYQISMQYGNGSVGWTCAFTVSRDITFTYSFTDNRVMFPQTENVELTVTAEAAGAPFTVDASDMPRAWIVHKTQRTVVDAEWNPTTADENEITVGTRTVSGVLRLGMKPIPAGQYDLVITWQGCIFTKEHALYVTAAQEAVIGQYTFGWFGEKSIVERGGMLSLTMTLQGPQTGTGTFCPEAVLVLDDDHMLTVPAPSIDDISLYTLPDGSKTEALVRIAIPYDALIGSYGLIMTFGGETAVFGDAIRVVRDENAVQGGTLEGEPHDPPEPGFDNEFTIETPGLVYEQTGSMGTALVSAAAAHGETEIRLASGVTETGDCVSGIKAGAFAQNRDMHVLYIPKGVTVIERGAFADTWLTTIYYQGYAEDWEADIENGCPGWNDGLDYVTVVCRDRALVAAPTGGNETIDPDETVIFPEDTMPYPETEIPFFETTVNP